MRHDLEVRMASAVAKRGNELNDKVLAEHFASHYAPGAMLPDPWGIFGSSIYDYMSSFRFLFDQPSPAGGIEEIKQLAQSHSSTYVLDVGASETAINELCSPRFGFSAGAAISLGYTDPHRNPHGPTTQLHGDVLQPQTWHEVDLWLKSQEAHGFNLIVSQMGFGACPEFLTNDPIVHLWLLNEIWKRLNPEGSMALLLLPDMYIDDVRKQTILNRALDMMSKQGIVSRPSYAGNAILRIDRKPGDQESLLEIFGME